MTVTSYLSALIARRNTARPAVWVGCLAAYNAGVLHGAWVEVSADADAMGAAVAEILAASPVAGAEEAEIMDTDNLPRGVRTLAEIVAYAAALEALEDHGHRDAAEIIAAWVDWQGAAEIDAERITEAYLGQHDTARDYAEAFIEDTGLLADMPPTLRPYFDYDAFTRDLELGGDIYHGAGGHTFDGHA